MLWTDSVFITSSDLTRIDSQVPLLANTEKIVLDGDDGLLRTAVEEVTNEMMKLIISFGGYLNSGDLTANHLAAVLNVGIGNSVRQKIGMQQIVVSGDIPGQFNPVKQWAVFWALRTFYRNAFARVTDDRFEKKMTFYKDEIVRRLQPSLFALGIPIVIRPMVRPGAYFEVNSGTWDTNNVSLVAGPGTLNGVSWDVVITYADNSQGNFYQSAAKRNNCESSGSERVTVPMTTGNVLSVNIDSLNPPTGAQFPAQVMVVVVSPLKACVWNIYAGQTGGPLYLQNLVPIPIGQTTYTLPGDPVTSGQQVGLGQYPDRRLSLVPSRQRA